MKENIYKIIEEVKNLFPFKGYMDGKESKYLRISQIILKELPFGSKILDIGCGPCDLTAIIAKLGYNLTGIDDLKDPWHLIGNNRKRIKDFAEKIGIKLIILPIERVELPEKKF